MALSEDQIKRYSRHILLPEVGGKGQEKIRRARVLVVGAGGLGSPAILYLAAAGVGSIGIVDFDVVDISNLQRQILHATADLGRPKVESAREAVGSINPDVAVTVYQERLTSANIMDILREYDMIIDGNDTFPTRYLVNDACVFTGKPNIYGSVFRFEGQASVFLPGAGPCYRCLYPEPPPPGTVPSCQEAGVLGVTPGIIGIIQATEALKLILKVGEPLVGRLLILDVLTMEMREVALKRDPHCLVCGDHPSVTQLIDYEAFCGIPA